MPSSPKNTTGSHLDTQAKVFGCPALLHLAAPPTAQHLDYLDLLPGRKSTTLLPDAVAETQGRPVLYLLDAGGGAGRQKPDSDAIRKLQRLLANRSEQACLGILQPGSLEVYPLNLDREALAQADPIVITATSPDAPAFFQNLAAGRILDRLNGQPREADFVFREIHDLLQRASEALTAHLKPLDVLSITGRALFFRFLHDRGIVLNSELSEICPHASSLKDVFSTAEKAAATSCWLDETFNGDLLPLLPGLSPQAGRQERLTAYQKFYRRAGVDTQDKVFLHLQAILQGWKSLPNSQFQLRLPRIDWGDLDFAHIPIGVLSQVYETFSRQWDERQAKDTSVYYTPKNIARCLVEEAFAGLKDPAEAHILDPACGAGIFLVLAFRRLVRARWEKDEQRPDTRAIQRILYHQVRGFDVSESALRLAALALYITAIEVNGSPRPPKSLKFPDPLQDRVLFNFGHPAAHASPGFVLGSLGPSVPARFNGAFDVIVTNPPWTRLRDSGPSVDGGRSGRAKFDVVNREFTAITQRVLKARKLDDLARNYTNPDNNPDLPFAWRAAEWAKPDGVIAIALSGRVLFKQSDQGKAARTALLRGLSVTGIINCSNLEQTDVWPNMAQPFILLFARNAPAPQGHSFYFATPVRESCLNDRGLFRLDYQAAEPVPVQSVIAKPWLLKSLAVGSTLDIAVMDKLLSRGWDTISSFWKSNNLYSGQGYNISENLSQSAAGHLVDLLDFKVPSQGFQIEFENLQTWNEVHQRSIAHMPRNVLLYKAPLLIVPKAPGTSRDQPKSFISRKTPICFSQIYYGFSAAGHPDAEILITLLYLITHSALFNYFYLMVSSSLGVERRIFIKVDLEAFPFPDPAKLTAAQKRRILDLAQALESSPAKTLEKIDEFIFDLYGLDTDDAAVVRDTLEMGAPYQSAREFAETPPIPAALEAFRAYLEAMLQPSFGVVGQQLSVALLPVTGGRWLPSWRFLTLALKTAPAANPDALLKRLMAKANRAAASRLVLRLPGGGLVLGLLNQNRFWTRSRARLCGLHLLRNHLAAFPLESNI